jgi:hypothetical protein
MFQVPKSILGTAQRWFVCHHPQIDILGINVKNKNGNYLFQEP